MREEARKGSKGKERMRGLDLLREQFHREKFHIIGIQAGRNERSLKGHRSLSHMRIAVGHENHSLGVELWADLDTPYGTLGGKEL
eukprot:5424079-Pyramimonas_sp.AAC.1